MVPNPAGSATDLVARVIARDLDRRLGQPVIIENRPGADGTIGVRQVVKSAPDGYTLSFGSPSAYAAAPYVYTNLAYDPTKDLVPISMVGRTPYAFAVYPGLGVKNILELVALAKAKPGTLNYSSIGEGSIAHLGMVVFAEKMGLQLQHVPYKTTAQSIIDVATGIIHMQLASIPPIVSLYESKRIQVLGIAGKNRIPLMADVPTDGGSGHSRLRADILAGDVCTGRNAARYRCPPQPRDRRRIADRRGQEGVHRAGCRDRAQHARRLGEILRRDIEEYREVATKAGIERH